VKPADAKPPSQSDTNGNVMYQVLRKRSRTNATVDLAVAEAVGIAAPTGWDRTMALRFDEAYSEWYRAFALPEYRSFPKGTATAPL